MVTDNGPDRELGELAVALTTELHRDWTAREIAEAVVRRQAEIYVQIDAALPLTVDVDHLLGGAGGSVTFEDLLKGSPATVIADVGALFQIAPYDRYTPPPPWAMPTEVLSTIGRVLDTLGLRDAGWSVAEMEATIRVARGMASVVARKRYVGLRDHQPQRLALALELAERLYRGAVVSAEEARGVLEIALGEPISNATLDDVMEVWPERLTGPHRAAVLVGTPSPRQRLLDTVRVRFDTVKVPRARWTKRAKS